MCTRRLEIGDGVVVVGNDILGSSSNISLSSSTAFSESSLCETLAHAISDKPRLYQLTAPCLELGNDSLRGPMRRANVANEHNTVTVSVCQPAGQSYFHIGGPGRVPSSY